MPQATRFSDSNYAAVSRHRRPFSTSGRPANVDIIDDAWATDRLPDDDVCIARHEAVVAPLLEEGELDSDAIVVSPTGNSSLAANHASERRRREEGWTDLGLDQVLGGATSGSTVAGSNGGPSSSSSSGHQQTPNSGSSS